MAEKLYSYADKQVMDEVGSGGGGGGTLIVHLSFTPPDNYTIDKTYNEIAEAASNGVSVMLMNPAGELEAYLTSTADGVCIFSCCGAYRNMATFITYSVTPDNAVSFDRVQLHA